MILYYAPGACSQACYIAHIEAGMSYRLVKVVDRASLAVRTG